MALPMHARCIDLERHGYAVARADGQRRPEVRRPMPVMTGTGSSFFQVRMRRGGCQADMQTGPLGYPVWLERDSLRQRSTHNNPLPDTRIDR
ncbi:hypothetical protein L3V59_19900 [Burkholderia aenigmatica]|nr:hypothetical protein [Burkholderia aenigmatica]UKD15221.1 hypothetical protein L3V59_19900 [Burkholderia aenigmatica]